MSTSSDHNRWDRKLAKLGVPEVRYKADLDLHDRSQAFSSELLKLALGGIAVVGFLLAHFPEERLERILDDMAVGVLFSASVVAFALSVASALLQRFYASGAMFHHLHVIKLSLLEDPSAETEIADHMQIRKRKFMQAHSLLKTTAWLLVVAALLVSIAFIRMMFLHA
ncbi:MAG: hypothetical protein Q8L02_03170 [Candidatus Nitrotoga sp.]|nr:hypothetical protein [Candidatus Nitrotoga sp.]